MDNVDVLLEYFSLYKKKMEDSNDKINIKKTKKIIDILVDSKEHDKQSLYITDFDDIKDIVEKYDINDILTEQLSKFGINSDEEIDNNNSINQSLKSIVPLIRKGFDSIMYDIILSVVKYNQYLMNKKVKSNNLPITADINFNELDVKLKDVLNYLEIKDGEIDTALLNDLSKMPNFEQFKEFAISIKTDNGMKRVLFDKIEDKNILLSILLHSNLDIINNIVKIFEEEKANINKVAGNIPSIFIKDLINSKCKYNVIANYDNFILNYNLLKENNLEFKKMLKFSVFFINDYNKNKIDIDKLRAVEI